MSTFVFTRPWLTAGLTSLLVLILAGSVFFASTMPTTGSPNSLWQLSGLGFVGIFIAIPGLAISLAGGSIQVWRRGNGSSRILAVGMLIVSLPFFLYGLFLLLAALGVVHVF